jgi:hypothetical protein
VHVHVCTWIEKYVTHDYAQFKSKRREKLDLYDCSTSDEICGPNNNITGIENFSKSNE